MMNNKHLAFLKSGWLGVDKKSVVIRSLVIISTVRFSRQYDENLETGKPDVTNIRFSRQNFQIFIEKFFVKCIALNI